MGLTLTGRREKVVWTLAGIAITGLVAYVLYSFVGAIVVGIFLYYATRPVYRWLDRWIEHPDVTATVTLMVVGVPLLLILGYATFVGLRELEQLATSITVEQLQATLEPYVGVVSAADSRRLIGLLRNNVTRILGVASATFTWSLRVFVAGVVAFYLLRDDHKIAAWFRRSVGERYGAASFVEGVDDDLTTIYTGNLVTIGITGVVAVAVYYGMNLISPTGAVIGSPLLLGLLTGVATLVPAVGMKLIYFPYTGFLLWRSQASGAIPLWFPVVFFVVTVVVVDSVPDIFIRSYVSKGDINMGLMLLTYVLGAIAFGWYGVFLGPIVLVLFLHFAREVFPAIVADGPIPDDGE